jgi:hypothetical protein
MTTYSNDSQHEQTKRSGLPSEHTPRGEAPDHTTPPKRRKTVWRRTRRVLLIVALLIVLLAGTGFLYQTIASAHDASSYPPPGKLIDMGGYRLHLYCTGTGRPGSPTVILEAGLAIRHWSGARSNRVWPPSCECAHTTVQAMVGAIQVHSRARLGAWLRNCTRSSSGLVSRVRMSWWGTPLVG